MIDNQIVIVTGGAGLIGQAFISAIVENGAVAIIADVDQKRGAEVKLKLMENLGTTSVEFMQVDITSKDSICGLIKKVDAKYGKIDALVNNAYPRNQGYGKHFFDVEYADFTENVGLNLGGYFLMSQQLAKYFKQQGYGNIVNISSIYGVVAPKFNIYEGTSMTVPVEYAAIKSGLIHLTKYMAKYFKGDSIRVNTLSPGGIVDVQPEAFIQAYRNECLNQGMLDKDDLKGTLIYLLSDMSKPVNGQNIVVDDGFSL